MKWTARCTAVAALLALAGCTRDVDVAQSHHDAGPSCTPETDQTFCERQAAACGELIGRDNCQAPRTAQCGGCAEGLRCDATHQCTCVAESDAQFCARLGRDCEVLSDVDNCGESRRADCGRCGAGERCRENKCELCTPATDAELCASAGKQCGSIAAEDPCAQSSRTPNCGECAPGQQCSAENACEVCTSESAEAFCQRLHKNCGTVTGLDNCRLERSYDCGGCTGTDFCDENDNTCHRCVSEPDEQLCSRNQVQCGPLAQAVDNCLSMRDVAECGPCPGALEFCNDQQRCELCVPETDEELCEWYFSDCGNPLLTDRCGQQRTPSCGSCPGPLQCQPNGVCGNGVNPTNDTCASPERLVFDATGTATATGSFTSAVANYLASCGRNGSDVVFALHLSTPSHLRATVVELGVNQSRPAIYLRGSCDGSELACAGTLAESFVGLPVTLSARALAAGDYLLFVSGGTNATGAFSLTVVLSAPVAPANDTCASPEQLVFSGDVASISGDTTEAREDYAESCGAALLDGGELIYRFRLTVESAVAVTLTPGSEYMAYRPGLALHASCPASGPAIGCATELGASGSLTVSRGRLAAGEYFVVVDGTRGSYGRFTLDVSRSAPVLADICSDAMPVLLAAGATAVLEGSAGHDSSLASDDEAGSCGGAGGGRELVFSFTLPPGADRDVTLEVTPAQASALHPVLYVRRGCAAADELACTASGSGDATELRLPRLSPGTYYAFVDGQPGFAGPFSLNIAATESPAPPSNDSCAQPREVVLERGWGQVSATTVGAADDYSSGCGGRAGPDAVFQITTAAPGHLAARVRSASGFSPVVYLRSSCADPASERICGVGQAETPPLPAGTYYIVVDSGAPSFGGAFTLDVFSFPDQANTDCAHAQTLLFDATGDATAVGDLCALSSVTTNLVDEVCFYSANGPDAVYKIELSSPKNLRVSYLAGVAAESVAYVRTACGTASSQIACTKGPGDRSNELEIKGLGAGTYYLWLDGQYLSTCGLFAAKVHLADPPPAPLNDGCATVEAIPIDVATGAGTASGWTDSAADDWRGSCATSTGGDAVYAFSLAETKAVEIAVTPQPSSELKPVLYLQASCGAALTENGCTVAIAKGGSARLAYPRLAAGTYYLVVDSDGPNAVGAFDLQINVRQPGATDANDLCAAAVAMPAFDATGKTSISGDTVGGDDTDSSYCSSVTSAFTGGDLAYSFVLAADAKVTAKVIRTGAVGTYKPAISLRRACGLATEAWCGADRGGTGTASVTATLAAGEWIAIVDGLDGTAGPFALEVSTVGLAGPAGDTCGNPIALDFQGASSVTVTGDLSGAGLGSNDYTGTCGPWWSGPDLVYALTLPAEKRVTAVLAIQGAGVSNLQAALSMRSGCPGAGTELACAYKDDFGATLTISPARLPAGTYYLIVDARSASYLGAFSLTVSLAEPADPAPANDDCSGAEPLVFDSEGAAHRTGDTREAHQDYLAGAECRGGASGVLLSGGDVVYAFTVAQGTTVTATLARESSTPGYWPGLYLRSACLSAAPAAQLACDTVSGAADSTVGLTAVSLAAGTYYLVVDGQTGSAGRYVLDVYARSVPATNTSCTAATTLSFARSGAASWTANVIGDTSQGTDTTQGIRMGTQNCSSAGADLYYAVTTTAVQDLTVSLTPFSANYDPAVYLRSACGDPTSQLGCVFGSSGKPQSLSKLKLPAGSYTLVVDSADGAGPFALQVTLSEPPPAPAFDTCAGAAPLSLPALGATTTVISGSTAAANDDYSGACATGAVVMNGPDVVYWFTVTEDVHLTAKVAAKSTSPNYKVALYLRTDCAAVSDDLCRYNGTAGAPAGASLVASVRAGKTYYLVVDGVDGTFGEYDLSLSVSPGYTAGDSCLDPLSLDALLAPDPRAPAELIATLGGDTTNALGDYESKCSTNASLAEYVYRLTLPGPSLVSLTVAPSGTTTYRPAFYLRTSCPEQLSELVCANTGYAQTPVSAVVGPLPAGTYFLFIESYSANGPFTASVRVKDVPPSTAPNDSCATASPLNFVPGTGTAVTATVSGQDSSWASNDAQGSCYSSRGADLVYTFTTAAAKTLTAVVTPASGQSAFRPVLYVRSVCDQSADASEYGCAKQTTAGSPLTLTVNSLPAGTWYLYVDDYQQNAWDQPAGIYSLAVTLDSPTVNPPANDACPGAQAIALTGQAPSVTTLTGQTTVGASNDAAGSCAGSSGPDVVYYFDLGSPAAVSALVTFAASGGRPAVYLRQNCKSVELACARSTAATTITATAPYLSPGRYYLWVDGNNATASDFQLELSLTVPTAATPPANDVCSASLPALTLGTPVTGTTVDAANSNLALSAACGSSSMPGPDVVYTYTPAQDGFFTVSLLTTGPNDVAVWMSDRCLDGPFCLAYDNTGTNMGQTDRFRYFGRAGTTYYIVVDSASASAGGSFRLTVN